MVSTGSSQEVILLAKWFFYCLVILSNGCSYLTGESEKTENPDAIHKNMKTIISASGAPAPIGPYSQAVLSNGFLFVSGQIAIDAATGKLIRDSIEGETRQVMKNIGVILKGSGMDFSNIVKSTIFLTDMNNFKAVNEVYGSYFKNDFPARETVQVSRLPKDASVEISVIATE